MTNRSETALPAADQGDADQGAAAAGTRLDRIMWATLDRARRHKVFLLLLGGGLVLRAITQIAYEPALLSVDSKRYIFGTDFASGTWGTFDPLGYTLLVLRPVLMVTDLAFAALLQHVLGVAMAAALYALMVRRGVTRWLAALAVAPVLLDAYQLHAEQTIMPDVVFEALLVAGIVLLLWQPRPTLGFVILGGLALGASAPVRQVGEALIAPALIYVVAAAPGWRRRLLHGAVLTVCFALPVVGYMGYSAVILHYGFELSNMGDAYLYGRTAHAADCATLKIPAEERPLCPSAAVSARLGVDGLVNGKTAPRAAYQPVQFGLLIDTLPMQRQLAYSVLRQQPMRVVGDITTDAVKVFALTRNTDEGDTPISRWQFQIGYPYYPPGITRYGGNSASRVFVRAGGGGRARVHWKADTVLRDYQLHGGYTPGPLFLLSLLAGIAGIFTFRRGRDPGLALACLLITGCAVAVLLGADLYEFSWRYQLPALVTLPVAGVFGVTAVARQIRGRRRPKHVRGRGGAHSGTGSGAGVADGTVVSTVGGGQLRQWAGCVGRRVRAGAAAWRVACVAGRLRRGPAAWRGGCEGGAACVAGRLRRGPAAWGGRRRGGGRWIGVGVAISVKLPSLGRLDRLRGATGGPSAGSMEHRAGYSRLDGTSCRPTGSDS